MTQTRARLVPRTSLMRLFFGQFGGFLLPFLVTGCVLLVSGLVSLVLLPGEDEDTHEAAANTVANRNSGNHQCGA